MFRKLIMLSILLVATMDTVLCSATLTDSLLVLAGKAEGHDSISLLNQVACLLLDHQPAASLTYSNMALEASRAGGNASDQAEALMNIGGAWIIRGDIAMASPFLDEADA